MLVQTIIHPKQCSMQKKTFLTFITSVGLGVLGVMLWNQQATSVRSDAGIVVSPSKNQTTEQASVESSVVERVPQPFYFSTMTHMEGVFKDNEVEALFNKHVADIRWAVALFDEYGVKLTIESGESFAKANTTWGTNILQEVLDRGHGVGTHADFGVEPRMVYTVETLTEKFRQAKALVDALVGAENNIGVSGGTSTADWVLASSAAGFRYMDAVTAFGYLSMPLEARPNGWTDGYIRRTVYHDPIPVDFAERLYPMVLADATDLIPDSEGVLVVLGGDVGELASLSEGRSNCVPDCVYDEADNTALMDAIAQAKTLRDPTRVTRLNIHIPLVLFDKKNETLLRSMLSQLQAAAHDGTMTFATQRETYEGYIASQNN